MKIILDHWRHPARIGAYEWEHHAPQEVVISLEITLDAATAHAAAQTDELAQTLDYAVLEQDLIACLQARHYALIESLAAAVAECVLAHPAAAHVQVRIDKPGALKHAASASIIHTVSRGDFL